MRAPSIAQIGRTDFTLAYLVAPTLAGAPVVAAVVLDVALVAARAAPLPWERPGGHRRRVVVAPPVGRSP